MELLSREDFREEVFKRDGQKCVVCQAPAKDAHHIIDRSLWENGGYYIENGASLCNTHHWEAEKTLISCKRLREAAGITELCYPDHFFYDEQYDHWGNILLSSGMRIKGELFHLDNVQKILKEAGVLDKFLKYIKFPRTYHLSDSPNLQNDDRKHEDESFFEGKYVTCSIKLDGENSSLYNDYIHARSIDSKHHLSRSWLKGLHGRIMCDIPPGYRICGENMYAKHSIHYKNLEDYFYVFSIWDNNNYCLPVQETLDYCELFGLKHVPIFYQGLWNREAIHQAFLNYRPDKDEKEGYVVRLTGGFYYKDYRYCTAKYVRAKHVRTDQFWMTQPVVPNELRG